MTDAYVGVRPKIEVGGTALAADLEVLLEQVVVDDHLHLPDMFLLRFRDTGRDVLKRGQSRSAPRSRSPSPRPGPARGTC